MNSRMRRCEFVLAVVSMTVAPIPGTAQERQASLNATNDTASPLPGGESPSGIISYPAEFFERYQSITAFDMVNRVPGFTIDDGGDQRGFGAAAGNVLINDRRPSTKQDTPSAILARISAEQVERIDLIRGRVPNVDFRGHTEVVNVVLSENAPAAIRWETYFRYNFDHGMEPFGGISLSDRWRDIEYNVGVDGRRSGYGDPGVYRIYDGNNVLTGIRTDTDHGTGPTFDAYLNASMWLGKNYVKVNTRLNSEYRDALLESIREPQLPGSEPHKEILVTLRRNKRLELGVDGERALSDDFLARAIVLYSLLDQKPSASQRDLDAAGQQTRFQLERDDTTATELITRTEFDWSGFAGHAIEVNLERAFNVLDNAQVFTDDTGSGPIVIDVPNSNTRVEEVRWNLLAQDTQRLGTFTLNYGLGFERSTISQSGDSNLRRSFTFLKPRAVLTFAPERSRRTRLRIEREVSQLDFADFVSAAVFEDNDVALGNPDLHPESTWIAELSHERRFGRVAVIKLTGFHHWITDVVDLLPLSATFEAPGNIGDGRRWGLIFESTMPILGNAQVGFKARWQDSSVTDPVTGKGRRLSGAGGFRGNVTFLDENRYAFDVDFRQDLEAAKISWGMSLIWRDRRVLYRANELDIFDEGYELGAFVQTTRWFGMKIALEGANMLDSHATRDRTIYAAERFLTPIVRRELRDGTNGARVTLRMSGSF